MSSVGGDAATAKPHLCVICLSPDASLCSQCKGASYCGRKCQRTDWPSHKILCKAFAEHRESPRPSADHYRAILFPPAAAVPEIVWVTHPFADIPNIDGSGWVVPFSDRVTERNRLDTNKRTYQPVEPCLYFANLSMFQLDDSPINASMQAIINPYTSKPDLLFKGPVLAYIIAGTREFTEAEEDEDYAYVEQNDEIHEDITLNHLRHLVDYCIWCMHRRALCSKPTTAPVVAATTLTCVDRAIKERWQMAMFSWVPKVYLYLPQRLVRMSPIYKLLGMKVIAHADFDAEARNRRCTYAEMLMMETDVNSPSWGTTPEEWKEVGNVTLVREDRTGLFNQDVDVLCMFCIEKVYAVFQRVRTQGGTVAAKNRANRIVCEKNLQAFKRDRYPELVAGSGGVVDALTGLPVLRIP